VDATGALWLNAVPHGAGRFHRRRYSPVSIPGGRAGAGRGIPRRRRETARRVRRREEPSSVRRRLRGGAPSAGPRRAVDARAGASRGRGARYGVGHAGRPSGPGARRGRARALDALRRATRSRSPGSTRSSSWPAAGSGSPAGAAWGASRSRRCTARRTAARRRRLRSCSDRSTGSWSRDLTDYGAERMVLAPDGRIWLSTPAGLVVVDPGAIPTNRVAPAVHVEEVVVDGRLLAGADRTGAAARVAANPGRVDVHFTALGLRTPERQRLEYRLDGVDSGWQPSRGPRVATYTQLRPGQLPVPCAGMERGRRAERRRGDARPARAAGVVPDAVGERARAARGRGDGRRRRRDGRAGASAACRRGGAGHHGRACASRARAARHHTGRPRRDGDAARRGRDAGRARRGRHRRGAGPGPSATPCA
jgi:hypothetical protein